MFRFQVIYGEAVVSGSGKSDDTMEELIVSKVEPVLGDFYSDGASTIMTAFIPSFILLGLVSAISILVEAVPSCPFFYTLNIMTFIMRSGVRFGGIGGLAFLGIPTIYHEFLFSNHKQSVISLIILSTSGTYQSRTSSAVGV